jgi:predicted metal-dependent hydrolase
MTVFRRSWSDGDRLEIAGAVVRLKVHGQARRVSLRVDRARREVVATAPSPRRLAEAVAFAKDRQGWIHERLAELPTAEPFGPGVTFDWFGQPLRLEQAAGRTRLTADAHGLTLAAGGEGEAYARSAVRLLKRAAHERLSALSRVHCRRLGEDLPHITVMDARGRWGSCRPAHGQRPAAIRYSWRLGLAPLAVADYVAAHECAHLQELNHGPRFWSLVRGLVGDERPHRAWLRAEGGRLHAFGLASG